MYVYYFTDTDRYTVDRIVTTVSEKINSSSSILISPSPPTLKVTLIINIQMDTSIFI